MATIVPACGPPNAKIALVGEAPGADEEQSGVPFTGASGRLLNAMLQNAGIRRDECYITNVVKQRPPANDFGVFYHDKGKTQPTNELLAAHMELQAELRRVNPNLIVPLGGEALRACTGKTSIEKWRGSILATPLGKVIATYHPAHILRNYEWRAIAELDLRRCRTESQTRTSDLPHPRFTIRPTFAEAMEFLARRPRRLAVDIETVGSGPKIHTRCIGFADSEDNAICIPLMCSSYQMRPGDKTLFVGGDVNYGTSYWQEHEEVAILQAMRDLLADPAVEKVLQNYPFDSTVIHHELGLDIANLVQDTMVAQHTCYCELPKGLDFLASIYTRVPYYSDYEVSSDEQVWIYNCWDCVTTFICAERLEREMKNLGVWNHYQWHVHPSVLTFARIEQRGVLIDLENRTKQATEIQTKLDDLTAQIQTEVGIPTFNPGSSKQLQEVLYGTLKLRVQFHHKTKRPTTDKNAIENLCRLHPEREPFLRRLQEHSRLSTLIEGFMCRPVDPDGRIRTHFNVSGTVTGRLSSSEPPAIFTGTNLQNVPIRKYAGLRKCFVAQPGWSLVKADLSQAEFRLVVWFAHIDRLIRRYTENPDFDVHRWVASIIYRKPESEISKAERGTAKNGVYGGNYKMSARRASAVYELEYRLAEWVLNQYRAAIPEIPAWWGRVENEVSHGRKLVGPYGNQRLFFGRLDDDLFRECYSHLPQSTVGCLINRAANVLERILPVDECRILLQVHDELVLECRSDLVGRWGPVVKRVMEYPLHFPGIEQPCVVPAEVSAGPNWYEQEKLKT